MVSVFLYRHLIYNYLIKADRMKNLLPIGNQNRKERITMSKIYFTLTGTNHYHGKEFLKKGTQVFLVKEPDNEYDKEAIRVEFPGLGKIGYVANSPYTVIGESISAGRMYEKMGKKATGKVKIVTPNGVVCKLNKKK
jgi:hypothetical protein